MLRPKKKPFLAPSCSGCVSGAVAFGAVCTGTNGFFIATSRLLLSMARSGILPAWFGEIHPKYRTPYKAILFTVIVVRPLPAAPPWPGPWI